jgi:molybdate transport system ATP-binding protein
VADRRLSVSITQSSPIPLDVRFTCDAGDVLAIFGPSGSGKSTILRTIAGLHRPAQATVRVDGRTWTETATSIAEPPYRRAVGFVFQEYALFPHMTALGNVMTALAHRPRAERRARAEALLELVHLTDHGRKQPHELSGGERQRVALARALAREPAVLLLDEPFAAVDRAVRRRLQDEIDAVRRTLDVPVVLVTHDFDDVIRLASHVLLLEQGRSVALGPVSTVMSRPDLSWLREAVGLGSIFEARVASTDAGRGLLELDFGGRRLLVADTGLAAGSVVRVRIPAREVILASRAPEGLSLHNVLAGTVSVIHPDAGAGHAIVQVSVGSILLLAEVTLDAVDRLGLTVGSSVYALVKSVSVDARPVSTGPRSKV